MAHTSFHLIRHATTDALGITLSGRGGPGLNAEGHAQATRLGQGFAGQAITAIFSSPQTRTLQTAQAIGLPVQQEPALDEVDFGPWTGQTFAALADRPDWSVWNACRSVAPAPGCETMLQVQARAAALLPRLHASGAGAAFVLVSHADVLKSILAFVLGMPIDMMQRLVISPASRSLVVLHDDGAAVEFVNRQ